MLPTPISQLHLSRYLKIVDFAKKNQNSVGYTEKHHILPRSMGGNDTQDNLILLTARQHFICHWLLWKAYRNQPMAHSFWLMQHRNRYYKVNSKTYSELKEFQSTRMKENNPQLCETVRKKNSDARKKNPPMASLEARKRVSVSLKHHYATIGHPCSGKEWKQETITCLHCGKEGGVSNMKRYHLDNCKSKS